MVKTGHAFLEYILICCSHSGANAFTLKWNGASGWPGHVFLSSTAPVFGRMINNGVLVWHLIAIAPKKSRKTNGLKWKYKTMKTEEHNDIDNFMLNQRH